MQDFMNFFGMIFHYALPILSVLVLTFAFFSFFKNKTLFSAFIVFEDSSKSELKSRQTLIGSSDICDILISGLSAEHAVITVKRNSVAIRPIKNKIIYVNGEKVTKETNITSKDIVSAGKRSFCIKSQKKDMNQQKSYLSEILSVIFLFLFEFLFLAEYLIVYSKDSFIIPLSYFLFFILQIFYFAFARFKKLSVEIIVLFLFNLGLSVVAPMGKIQFLKLLLCFLSGVLIAFLIYKIFSDIKIARLFKLPVFLFAAGLFIANIIIGTIYNGSQNWIEIGLFSFQPSELVKIALIFLAADSAVCCEKGKNLFWFSSFSFFCIAVLVYLRDFGTAAVYLAAYLTVILLRGCNFKIFLIISLISLVLAGIAAFVFPYVAKRLFSFGHAWENAYTTGYQQTSTMIASASGGLFGVGTGKGYLRKIAAFDTDIVFGLICEELGFIVAAGVILCFVFLAFYTVRFINKSYVPSAVSAAGVSVVFLTQMSLNVFGSVDMLPFTGVTLPFISNGGSSIISCAALISFIKAAERDYFKIK